MENKDNNRFKAAIKTLAINAGVEIEADKLKIYFMALEEFDINHVEKACAKVLRTWKYNTMPTVAHIIEAIEGQLPQLEDKALVCANRILEHLKYYGSTKELKLDDPIAMRLMRTRWDYYHWAQTVLTDELKWWVKDFCAAYRSETKIKNIQISQDIKPLLENIGNE